MSEMSDNAPPLEEQLVAYLDGELDEVSARRVEELLATDLEARQTLLQLDRAWQLLDELQSDDAPPEFTRTTLEMVTVEAARRFEQSRVQRAVRTWGRRLLLGGLLLAVGLAGYVSVAFWAGGEERRLLEDLPLLENLSEYRRIDSLDLLRALYREGLFTKDESTPGPGEMSPESPASVSDAAAGEPEDDVLEQRRQLEAMTAEQQEQLRHRREEFNSLAPTEQKRLRGLHEALATDPQRAELEAVMHRYCRWLDDLPAYRVGELEELDLDERVARIKRLREAELEQRALRASPQDLMGLFRWMQALAAEQEARLVQSLPPERRASLERLNPGLRRGMTLWLMWQRWRVFRAGGGIPPLDEKQLAEMRSKLTPETRRRLEQMSPAEQWQTVAGWIREEVRRRFTSRGHSGLVPLMDDEALAEFFENELTDEQRDRLLNLSGDEMQRELQRMYLMSLRVLEPGTTFPGGKRPGWSPGFSPPGGHYPHRPPHGFPGRRPSSPGKPDSSPRGPSDDRPLGPAGPRPPGGPESSHRGPRGGPRQGPPSGIPGPALPPFGEQRDADEQTSG